MNENKGMAVKIGDALLIFLGTIPLSVARYFNQLIKERGPKGIQESVRIAGFDFSDEAGPGEGALPPGTVVLSRFNKTAARALSVLGRLWNIPRRLWNGDGISTRGQGAGNKPIYGNLFAKIQYPTFVQCIEAVLRRFQSHRAAHESAEKGRGVGRRGQAPVVYIVTSGGGGTGNGAGPVVAEAVREVSRRLDQPVYVNGFTLGIGTFEMLNAEQGIDNQNQYAKWAVAAHMGLAQNLEFTADEARSGPLIDSVTFNTNVNQDGEISNLEDFKRATAEFLYTRFCTPACHEMAASEVDADKCAQPDALGIPAVVRTGAVSVINLERAKCLAYAALQLVRNVLVALTTVESAQRIRDRVHGLLQSLSLCEGIEGSVASRYVRHCKELGGMDALTHAKAAVERGLQGRRGMARIRQAIRCLGHMDQISIPQNYRPLIERQADVLRTAAREGIGRALAECDQQKSGPAERAVALEECNARISAYRDYNRRQLTRLAEDRQTIHRRVAALQDKLARNQRRFWAWRWILTFLLWSRSRRVEDDAARMVAMSVEEAARKSLEERLYAPLLGWTLELGREIRDILALLSETAHLCSSRIDEIRRRPSSQTVSLGVELAGVDYLEWMQPRVEEECGGLQDLIQRAAAAHRKRRPEPARLRGARPDELLAEMTGDAEEYFTTAMRRLDLWEAVERRYPTPDHLREAVMLCVNESAGRLRNPEVEASQSDQWFKILMAPKSDILEKLEKILPEVDRKRGEWKPILSGDSQRIVFSQVRYGISLATLYVDGKKNSESKSVQELAESGPDPVIALQPGLKLDRLDAETILLKAWILGRLDYDERQGFRVQVQEDANPESLGLGEAAADRLQMKYPAAVGIHQAWAHLLKRSPADVMAALDRFNCSRDGEVPHALRDIVSPSAVERVRAEAQVLRRYF